MALKYCLILIVILSAIDADCKNYEYLLKIIRGNISLSETYKTPTNNEYMLHLKNKKIHDFGEFDFIIIGAGSAGTLIANRLTEIKNWRVLLLEAGGDENDFTGIPGSTLFLQNSPINWGYNTVPQTTCCLGMKNNSCVAPRGKVLGGCSVINVKMYVRANKNDYNCWEEFGNPGWGYEEALRYFKKTENTTVYNAEKGYHSHKGPLHVEYIEQSQYTKPYLNGLRQLGYRQVDYNGRNQVGASPIQYTINGLTISSGGRAFIYPILHRKNLNVTLNAFVTKLLFSESDSTTVVGVEFIKDGKRYHAKASKEVIVSAGAYNTPQILIISGIGPRSHLEDLGIKVRKDAPVGRYLQEHPLYNGFIVRTGLEPFNESLEDAVRGYLKGHRPLTSPINTDSQAFIPIVAEENGRLFNLQDKRPKCVKYSKDLPDIQQILIVPPGFLNGFPEAYNFKDDLAESIRKNYNPRTDIIIFLILLRPESYGSVELQSADPKDFPKIDYNMWSDARNIDIDTMYKGVQKTFELLETKAFKAMKARFVPTAVGCGEFDRTSRKYWDCAIRQMTSTIYHPMGTARMGPNPYTSVVNPDLQVHGIKRLRVSDASVMASMPSGNLNAPTYMIAEQTADRIKRYYKVLK